MKLTTLQLFVFLALAGCSNKDMYNHIQSNGKSACQKEPPARYDECMARYGESYASYKQSRDQLLRDSE